MKLSRALCLLLPLFLASCVTNDPGGTTPQELGRALSALSPTVDRAEADHVADRIYLTAARLRREYNVTSSAVWQNFLIKTGARKKGYCYHYAEDILASLHPLHIRTLDVHWAIADPGCDTESNCLIITAKGEPLTSGILIDAWREGGRVFWKRADADRDYKWMEDASPYARQRIADFHAR